MADPEKNEKDDSEISIIDILAILIRKRWIWIAALAAGIILSFSLMLAGKYASKTESNLFTTKVKILVVDPMINTKGMDRAPSSGNMAAAVASGSEIAERVGRKLGSANGLKYSKAIKASYDDKSGVLSMEISAGDKAQSQSLAQAGAGATIDYMKEIAAEHYASNRENIADGKGSNLDVLPQFKIIDLKTEDGQSSDFSVKKAIVLIIAFLLLGVLLAFIANAWDNTKKDPEAMKKLIDARKGK